MSTASRSLERDRKIYNDTLERERKRYQCTIKREGNGERFQEIKPGNHSLLLEISESSQVWCCLSTADNASLQQRCMFDEPSRSSWTSDWMFLIHLHASIYIPISLFESASIYFTLYLQTWSSSEISLNANE